MKCLKNEIQTGRIDWEQLYLVDANNPKAWLEGLLTQNLEILDSNASISKSWTVTENCSTFEVKTNEYETGQKKTLEIKGTSQ